jgi:hypothetical protein
MEKKQRPLRPRDLIADNLGREGIVEARLPAPSKARLEKMRDVRLRGCARSKWWSVIPLSGGSGAAPERYASLLREATVDDVRAAVACAMPAGVTTLLALFPEIQTEPFILGRVLLSKSPAHTWRSRFERGDAPAEELVRPADRIIVAFVEQVIVTEDPAVAMSALRTAVLGLNTVIGTTERLKANLDEKDRARLLHFLLEVAQAGGLRLEASDDPTSGWRTW